MSGYYEVAFIVVGLLAAAALLVNSIAGAHHLIRGAQFQQAFARRVRSLRLHRMLRGLGIDTSRYMQRVDVDVLEEQVDRCETCPSKQVCDEHFDAGKAAADSEAFCPNHQSLAAVRQHVPEILGKS